MPELGPIDGMRILNPEDVPFEREVKGQEDLLDDFYGKTESQRFRRLPGQALLELHPFEGDLVLAMGIHGWGPSSHLRIEIAGSGDDLELVMVPPPMVGPTKVGDWNVRQGLFLRIPQEVLPRRPGRARLTVRALAPLSSPKAYAEVEEVLQLVKGPMPAAFTAPGTRAR
jgi:hypothetical protein